MQNLLVMVYDHLDVFERIQVLYNLHANGVVVNKPYLY